MIPFKHLAVLFLSTLLVANIASADYSEKEPIEQTAPFNADGTLSVDNVNGSVEVRAWDRNEIRIEGEKSARTEEELKLIQLTIDTSPGSAEIKVKLPKRQGTWFGRSEIRAAVKFVITVPATARLRHVGTVNGGVSVTGIRGPVHASTVNGRVRVDGVSDTAKLTTVNGSVEAALNALPPSAHVDASTVNGSVTLRLPANASAAVKASTVNGHIDCEFPLQVSGRIGGRRLDGTIGDGGAAIRADTVNGSVKIVRL